MNLTCIRCHQPFENPILRGYCDKCAKDFHDERSKIHARQRLAPGVLCDGTFTDMECPQTIGDPDGRPLCGLCGSDQLHAGYGLGTGYGGCGCYQFCYDCNSFLDFVEDRE